MRRPLGAFRRLSERRQRQSRIHVKFIIRVFRRHAIISVSPLVSRDLCALSETYPQGADVIVIPPRRLWGILALSYRTTFQRGWESETGIRLALSFEYVFPAILRIRPETRKHSYPVPFAPRRTIWEILAEKSTSVTGSLSHRALALSVGRWKTGIFVAYSLTKTEALQVLVQTFWRRRKSLENNTPLHFVGHLVFRWCFSCVTQSLGAMPK